LDRDFLARSASPILALVSGRLTLSAEGSVIPGSLEGSFPTRESFGHRRDALSVPAQAEHGRSARASFSIRSAAHHALRRSSRRPVIVEDFSTKIVRW
jgi:hypothetical protein